MSAANGQYNERDVDAKTNSTITAPSNSFQFQLRLQARADLPRRRFAKPTF
jgi:hypothetical protein